MEVMNKTKLDWDKFAGKFGSYRDKIESEFKAGILDECYAKAKELSKQGKKVFPASEDVFRALIMTPYEDLKVVMMGLSPYHTEWKGSCVADGLLMGASRCGNYFPPSLEQFFGALEAEFNEGLCLECVKYNDMSFLANQGVLMWNISLMTESGVAGSMLKEWRPFMSWFFENIVLLTGVPVITLGKVAAEIKPFLGTNQWHFELSHPASILYKDPKGVWSSGNTFESVNKVLKDMNNEEVIWLPTLEQYSELLNLPF